ncbi:hypothetical protein [Spiroplasma endosymbiont of Agriotes lineatus]|uniref:hypothetical protein n=1 Tax=Spiroplasma endosymbiont of Agriotes lineatus TaxID=3077930 RepID=UPI0030CEFF76
MYILVEQRGYVVYDLYDQEVAIFMLMPEAIAFIKRQYNMPQQITISHKQHYPVLPVINNHYPSQNQNALILQNPHYLNQPPVGRQNPYASSMVNGNIMYPDNSNFVVNEQRAPQYPNPNLVIREKFEPTINMTNSMLNEQLFNEQEYRLQLNGNGLQQQSGQKINEQEIKIDKFRQHLDDVVKQKQLQSNGTENKLGVNSKPSSFGFNSAKQSKINSSGTIDLKKADIEQKLKNGFSISNMDALQQSNDEENFIYNNKIKTWLWVLLIILAIVIIGFGILGLLVGINVGGISDKIKELII